MDETTPDDWGEVLNSSIRLTAHAATWLNSSIQACDPSLLWDIVMSTLQPRRLVKPLVSVPRSLSYHTFLGSPSYTTLFSVAHLRPDKNGYSGEFTRKCRIDPCVGSDISAYGTPVITKAKRL